MLLNSAERIEYIDYAKALGIILVIAGHTNAFNGFCKVWIYGFHMPLFFLLSGMLLKARHRKFTESILKRVKRLLVPYIIWAFIYSSFSLRNLAYIFYGSHQSLSMASSFSSLWFMPVLFLAFIACESIITEIEIHFRARKESIFLVIVGGVFLLIGFSLPNIKYGYPFGLNVAFTASGFMLIGKCLISLFNRMREFNLALNCVITVIAALISLIAYWNVPDYGYILMGEGIYNNPILFLISAFAGSIFVLCIAIILERIPSSRFKRGLQFVGKSSLAIMLLHKPVISVVSRVVSLIPIPMGILLVISCLIVLIVCCIVTWVINKLVPQLIGN